MTNRFRKRVIFDTGRNMLTKQSQKQECDLNYIVKQHASTGLWPHLTARNPTYGDVSMATDLQSAFDLVQRAEDDFDTLPAEVRAACNNNPVKLLEALADPKLAQVLVDHGLPLHEPEVDLADAIATGVSQGLQDTQQPPEEETPPG